MKKYKQDSTIKVKKEIKDMLSKEKVSKKESYNKVVARLLKDKDKLKIRKVL